jgi:CubicO group peptidase (beta-lactamase class C family)
MKTATLLLGLTLSASALAAPPAPHEAIPGVSPEPVAGAPGLTTPQELEAFLDGIMTAHLKAQRTPGATVAVVKDGQLFFAKGYGYADAEAQKPVDAAHTLFRCGSVSKLFTWTALMQLVEQGKVSLDADVNTYITQFKLPDTYPGHPVTVKNLLTHTAGFEDGGLGFLIVDKPERVETLAGGLANHMPARVHPPTTDFNTAENSAYSNWGAALAGLIVEDVSGMPFDDYIEKNIFQPLGMNESTFRQPVPPAILPQLSASYAYKKGLLRKQPFEYVNLWPAGSMSMPATDIAKFMIAHLGDGAYGDARILKPETAQLMHSRVMSPSPYVNGSGLGFYENWTNGHRVIAHGGDLQFFHSDLMLLPDDHVGLFVSYNAAATLGFSARGDLFAAFMDRYFPAKLPPVKAPDDFKSRAATYAGSYRMNRLSHTKFEKLFSIISAITIAPTDRNTLLFAFGPFAWELVEVKPGVFRRTDAEDLMAFTDERDGHTQYLNNFLSLPFIGAYRIAPWETPGSLGAIAAFAAICGLYAFIVMLRNWKADRGAPPTARRARRVAGLAGALNLAFLVGLATFITMLLDDEMMPAPQWFLASRILPLLSVVATAAMAWFAVGLWRGKLWTTYARIQYTALVLGSVGFLWLACYCNLLGFGG